MSYVTQQGLVERYGEQQLVELTDRSSIPPTTIDATVVARAIADADALIDGYVGKRYALPIAAVPDLLERLAADVARFFLYGPLGATEAVRQAYEDALRMLRDIAAGTLQLDLAGVEVPAAGQGGVQMSADIRQYTRKSLVGF